MFLSTNAIYKGSREEHEDVVMADEHEYRVEKIGDVTYRYRDGKLHCDDGPAIEGPGIKIYANDGEFHREDGPAYITDNSVTYYRRGKLHRKDGPAIVIKNPYYEAWYRDGVLHRTDGPAQIVGNIESYHLNGKRVKERVFKQMVENMNKGNDANE